jgi:hypothetical protein
VFARGGKLAREFGDMFEAGGDGQDLPSCLRIGDRFAERAGFIRVPAPEFDII